MKAIIMAGGEGTRLRPLTCSVPKPLSLLCGRPVVYYILDLLNEHGFDEAVFTLGYKSEQIEQLFETGQYKNVRLKFSREDAPLGTAGCVKKAVSAFGNFSDLSESQEPFLVISGDALCDFDLTAVMREHARTGAAATIITKKVDDPREYGLIISDSDNKITGFSEKPSYLGCASDYANTGVYVLSPRVIDFIPDGKQFDFARDVFPQMMNGEQDETRLYSLYSYEEQGYWCDIGDFSTYTKSQMDILNGKVKCHIEGRQIANRVYTQSEIPRHVIIKPPCYIGKNVTFSHGIDGSFGVNGSIDVCSSVICDNVNVGNNVKLMNTVVLNSAFISDGVTANNAVICKSAKLHHSASVYEGSVIGDLCVIGREATVSGGAKIWNEKSVPNGACVTRDVKYGCKTGIELTENGIIGQTNVDITPELCCRIGAALTSSVVGNNRVAVSCEDNNAFNAADSMKRAIIAGATGSGGEVFDMGTLPLPQMLYFSSFLNCGIIARIKCGVFAEIKVLSGNGLQLTRQEERRFEAAVSRYEYKTADWRGFGKVHAISGIDDMYTSALMANARFKSDYKVKINCNNAEICEKLTPVFDRISGDSNNNMLIAALTDGGSKAELYTTNNIKASYEQLVMLASASFMKSGYDVALPNDFVSCAEFLAESYGRQVYRYFLCSNDMSDRHARELAARQPFLRDGAVLVLTVLEYLAYSGLTLESALKSLPQFACERREVEINCPPQRIIARICNSGAGIYGKDEGVLFGNDDEKVLIRSAKRGKSLFVTAESLSSETAAQLCDDAEILINRLIAENNA